jgi:signal recognition particle receptor subunit alpha
MIDCVTVATKGGLVLWKATDFPIGGEPINALIKNVLLEDRLSEKSYNYEKYTLKWTLENDLNLIFVVVYQKLIQLLYVEELLDLVKQKFIEMFKDVLQETRKSSNAAFILSHHKFDFDQEYRNILKAVEQRDKELRSLKKMGMFQKQNRSDKTGTQIQKESKITSSEEEDSPPPNGNQMENGSKSSNKEEMENGTTANENIQSEAQIAMFESKSKKQMRKFVKKESNKNTTPSKSGKAATKWDDLKYTKEKEKELDVSKKRNGDKLESFKQKYLPDTNAKVDIDKFDDSSDEEFNPNDYQLQKKTAKKGGILSNFFNNLTNGRVIDKEELKPVMEKFKEGLIAKNVASEIADKICQSVAENLDGKKISAFTSLASEVTKALEETMSRILTPRRNIDILRDIMAAREQHRPYVITFCGVNGVGKSTSLSKICFWLLQNNFTCLIAACDTFRSGAVEQLEVHAKCLNVPIFNRGYGKDISVVAKEAINEAKKKNYDVVLIDTAGRMQDNEPLMRSLTKLIHLNKPDLVLFVGEALVGNDGIDQLMKFNDALKNIAMGENTANQTDLKENLIDGIVLTKFDTIDDKVGAAISMVYKTGHPIVFVGVGQTYPDLKKLSIKSVVKSLLK